ncbi:hypothetical protein K2X33_14720 [bacterium]|nr:hypothetical protein [bacterium]
MSERDIRREQFRMNAESKRQELSIVAGHYQGVLLQKANDGGFLEQEVEVDIQIKDIPRQIDGDVDPILTPILTGYLKLLVGSGVGEFLGFGVEKAEYDPKRFQLDLVCKNLKSEQIILSLAVAADNLSGTWTSPEASVSGEAKFERQRN